MTTPARDEKLYRDRTYAELLTLTRYLASIPIGELSKEYRRCLEEFGEIAPSTVFTRAVQLTRLALAETRNKHGKG